MIISASCLGIRMVGLEYVLLVFRYRVLGYVSLVGIRDVGIYVSCCWIILVGCDACMRIYISCVVIRVTGWNTGGEL